MLIKYLEQLSYLKPFSYFEEYRDNPNYEYEIFALNHSTQINGEVRLIPNPPSDFNKWIMYIEQRALTSKNVILRAKYNDLIWIYKKLFHHSNLKVGNVKDKCSLAIEDYIILIERDILSRKNDEELLQNLKNYLFRAWHLCKEIKSPLQSNLIQLMIEVEDSIENDSSIGLWGFSFKKLIKDSTISLNDDQVNRIINRIKIRVKNLDGKEYYALEYAIKLLLEYYKENPTEQEKYLPLLIRNAHIKSKRPFENQNRFREIIKLCEKYKFKELKEEATISYQKYGADVTKQMARIEHKFEVTHEQFQELIQSLSDVDCRIHFLKVTRFFISSKSRIEENYDNHSQNFFFRDLFSTALVNEDGVTTKTLTSKEDTLYHENKMAWQIQLVFFDKVIKNFIATHQLDPEDFTELLYDELLYKNCKQTLTTAIKALYFKDYITMCYVCTPLIENALRQLLFQCDHTIYEENKHNGFENITLTKILSKLGEYLTDDFMFHLQFILNEKAGLNLRNEISHGLLKDSNLTQSNSYTLLHVLMVLKLIVGF